ncbi:MAG TPA: HEAT repeat domain-containing protein [Bacteroidota bacterium]|nr:HEAT repeat domain-containing protein [Bacteroidota bacterium]
MMKRLVFGYLLMVGVVSMNGMAYGHGSTPTEWNAAVSGVAFGTVTHQNGDSRQIVIRHTDTTSSLTDRWKWAKAEAGRKDFDNGYWIGYSIEKQMGERSFIGSYYSDQRRNKPSLGEIVTGVRVEDLPSVTDNDFTSMEGTMDFDDEKKPRRKVRKEVGLLFHMRDNRADEIGDQKVSNMSLRVDLDGDPLIWVGGAGYEESVAFLEGAFKQAKSPGAKKEFMMAIGLHNDSKRAIEILKQVLLGDGDTDLREDAAFWLGQTNTDEARKILNDVAWKDHSQAVREKCIFSLSEMDGEASTDAIISLAKGHKDDETRKQAVFWLGQKASEKALGALKELAYEDEDTEVQKSAMFALTQMEHGGGIDELIKIARTHPNPKIRKDAIFWLGQSEDPKAVDVLVEMVKGK